ncbi:Peroxisomal multifunctional enzyme type 2 [Diplonema papillatum]|nr:Peroxisomal multifunctional enzyme type 2 [Diplonema papillatum]
MDLSPYMEKPVTQSVAYNRRDLLLYALGIGIGDLRYVHEKNRYFAAFPTYPIVLSFKGDAEDVVSFPSPAMKKGNFPLLPGEKVGLDGERSMEFYRPIPAGGAKLLMTDQAISCIQKGKGAAFETETMITDESGRPYVRIVSSAFRVGAKGFKDYGESHSAKIAVPRTPPTATFSYRTSEQQAVLYRLSGDYNPLHIDPAFAKMSGFGQPILHGLCTFGTSTQLILQHYAGNDPKLLKSVRARFSSPVIPGQTLEVLTWRDGNRIVFVTRVKETGSVCINNACVELHATPKL